MIQTLCAIRHSLNRSDFAQAKKLLDRLREKRDQLLRSAENPVAETFAGPSIDLLESAIYDGDSGASLEILDSMITALARRDESPTELCRDMVVSYEPH